MCIYIYIYILYIYIYIHTHTHTCVYIYIYVYTFIHIGIMCRRARKTSSTFTRNHKELARHRRLLQGATRSLLDIVDLYTGLLGYVGLAGHRGLLQGATKSLQDVVDFYTGLLGNVGLARYFGLLLRHGAGEVRSVFKISCLFLWPRPWQFEI